MSIVLITLIAVIVNNICFACLSAAMLPFVTDQLIAASSDKLSSVVHWFYFFRHIGLFFTDVENLSVVMVDNKQYSNIATVLFTCGLSTALIIISDCLCLQWLNRTHKVSNPIKLIVQVLNYTRKHSGFQAYSSRLVYHLQLKLLE